ncbi:MAG: DUF2752 domain-containing protein [Sedimentisphaerales bacterium]|nr:DUF2752 domain-containing protein [Sedimentisphaerales bacterium]
MKIEWLQVPRRPNWPWWAVLIVALWLGIGGVLLLLAPYSGQAVPFCLFKCLTGCPCPSCGFTRGTLSFLHGHPIQAWLCNPLLFSFLAAASAIVLIRLLSGKSPRLVLTRRERLAAWGIGVALFIANWLYVIHYVG